MRSRFTLGLCVTLGFRSVQNVGPRGTSRIQVDCWLPIYTPVAGKGFLAADESAGPWLRAGHAEAAKIPDAWHFGASFERLLRCALRVDSFDSDKNR